MEVFLWLLIGKYLLTHHLCPTALSPCPIDNLDTVHQAVVLNQWLTILLQEAKLDNGGNLNNLSLRNALQDIQNHILKAYGTQAISGYDFPDTGKLWKGSYSPPTSHCEFLFKSNFNFSWYLISTNLLKIPLVSHCINMVCNVH